MEKGYRKGEIILYKGNDTWSQFVEETDEGVKIYDGLKYFFCDLDEIEKAILPLALDGLGFRLIVNRKNGTEAYRYRKFKISLINDKYFINGQEVNFVSDVQHAFGLFNQISFRLHELRLSSIAK